MRLRVGEEWQPDVSIPNELRLFRVKRRLFRARSDQHRIEIVELEGKGRGLFLDDCARIFEADEFIYHEALIHPAMWMARVTERPVKVLIIGDGDGGAVREILKFSHVDHVTWVDVDPILVEACMEHLGFLPREALDDQRLTFVGVDGEIFMRTASSIFDVVIVSVTDYGGQGPERRMYADRCYSLVRRVLTDNGIFARSLCSVTPSDYCTFNENIRMAKKEFGNALPYSIGLPAFGIDWGFVIAAPSTAHAAAWKSDEVKSRFLNKEFFNRSMVRPTLSLPRASNYS